MHLAPGASLEDVIASVGGDRRTPVDRIQLLCVLGGEAESGEVQYLSHDIWHLDAECIEDHGDYVRLAERFAMLAKNDLQISDFSDSVDVESGEAWFEFNDGGRRERWTIKVDNDWMDPAFYTRFQELLKRSGSKRRFMICALGQDSLVLCGEESLRREISRFTGLEFAWE